MTDLGFRGSTRRRKRERVRAWHRPRRWKFSGDTTSRSSMPAPTSCPTSSVLVEADDLILGALADIPSAPQELLEVIAQIPDPRKARGIRHPLPAIILLAVAAVVTGATSFAAIAQWAHHCGRTLLDAAGMADARVPSEPTIRRILERIDPEQLDLLVYAWIRLSFTMVDRRRVIACDGKTVRGAKDSEGNQPHLLAAMDHASGAVVGQVDVEVKTNEIPCCVSFSASSTSRALSLRSMRSIRSGPPSTTSSPVVGMW